MITRYLIGSFVRMSAEFKHLNTLEDPSGVALTVKAPYGSLRIIQPVRDDVGAYYGDIEPGQPGTWRFRFQTTGAVVAAADGAFMIDDIPAH